MTRATLFVAVSVLTSAVETSAQDTWVLWRRWPTLPVAEHVGRDVELSAQLRQRLLARRRAA